MVETHALPPLVVDLDGTLIRTDLLHESSLRLLRDRPLDVLAIPAWLAQGKSFLKRRLAERVSVDATTLPYDDALLDWLREQRRAGRALVLCTASDRSLADAVAGHLGLFDEVIASDGVVNVAGERKADALVARFGERGFDYAGNETKDAAVWSRARHAIVVNASAATEARARAVASVERVFPPPPRGGRAWLRALRLHQWLKNLLLLVPMFAGHQVHRTELWLPMALAFLAFSLCASSVYIANDLLDLDSDRRHPRKRARPFATGALPIWQGVLAAPALLTASVLIGLKVGAPFLAWLAVYFTLTCAYSWLLKRLVLVDCLVLAVLYTLRIAAGGAASAVAPSFWLLAFSVFLFLSLAFVKRYAELLVQAEAGREVAHGRGYRTADTPLVQAMGIGAGYAAAMVLALYLNSEGVARLYRTPELLWGSVLVVLFWINWMWMRAHRGQMHDDPLVFAIRDPASIAAGAVGFAIVAAASIG